MFIVVLLLIDSAAAVCWGQLPGLASNEGNSAGGGALTVTQTECQTLCESVSVCRSASFQSGTDCWLKTEVQTASSVIQDSPGWYTIYITPCSASTTGTAM